MVERCLRNGSIDKRSVLDVVLFIGVPLEFSTLQKRVFVQWEGTQQVHQLRRGLFFKCRIWLEILVPFSVLEHIVNEPSVSLHVHVFCCANQSPGIARRTFCDRADCQNHMRCMNVECHGNSVCAFFSPSLRMAQGAPFEANKHGPIELFIRSARVRTANVADPVALFLTARVLLRHAGEGDEVLVQDSVMLGTR